MIHNLRGAARSGTPPILSVPIVIALPCRYASLGGLSFYRHSGMELLPPVPLSHVWRRRDGFVPR